MSKQHTAAELRAKLEQQAADGNPGARFVLRFRQRIESGEARQLTPEECVDPQRIAALYARFGR